MRTDKVQCGSECCRDTYGKTMNCDNCNYFVYDEDDDDWYCTVNMDEDDYARLIQGRYRQCPYYRHEDEYQIVRHQM